MIRELLISALFLGGAVASWADPWLEDFEAAKQAAATANKPILVNISGSDWCVPGQQMDAEVFTRPDFLTTATAKYVLLKLDFPRNFAQPERRRAQNKALARRYFIDAFPTFLLLDSQGTVFARRTGYLTGGVTAFFGWTASVEPQQATLVTLADAVKKAAPGTPRAQAQDALFRQAEAWGLETQFADLPFQIVQQDKDGQAGLKPRYQVYNAYQRRLATWSQDADFHKSIDDFDALAERATPWPDLRQKILFTQGMVWWNALWDEIRARDTLRLSRALGPDTATGQKAKDLLDQLP